MKKITFLAALLVAFSMNAQIFSDNFDLEIVDATTYTNWTTSDLDGDTETWEVFDADATGNAWIFSGLGADSDSWESGNANSPMNPDNWLVTTAAIDLTTATGVELVYQVGTYQTNGTFLDDQYAVWMSTSSDPATIMGETPLRQQTVGDEVTAAAGDGSDSATEITIDASAFAGQMVYLAFRHWNTFDNNSVLIDNVRVSDPLSVGDESFNGFIHALDANGNLKLVANTPMESVQLFNVLGQQVVNQRLTTSNEVVNIAALNTGVYIATVTIEGQSKTFKIIKK